MGLDRAAALAADQPVGSAVGDGVLGQPQRHADQDQHRGQAGRLTKVHRRGGGVAVNIGSKDIESDAPAKGIGGAVLRQGLDEDEQSCDGIVAGEQRGEDLAQPQAEPGTEHGAALLQAGGDVQDGVFQDRHHKGEHVQRHDQHQPAEGEEAFRDAAGEGEQLLKEPAPLHEQDPAHRRDVGRGHKGHHEHDVQPLVFSQLAAGQQVGGGRCDDGGKGHYADAEEQGIPDGLQVFRVGDDRPGAIQVEAAIYDDRLGEYRNQGADDQKRQNKQQHPQDGADAPGR